MCVWHVFQLEMGGLREILDDIQPLNPKQYERKEQDVHELNSKEEDSQRSSLLEALQRETGCIVTYEHSGPQWVSLLMHPFRMRRAIVRPAEYEPDK
jgi:hypothetical protein